MENVEIVLRLPAKHINVVLASLGKQPLELVLEPFAAIKEQTERQLKELRAGPPKAAETEAPPE